MTTRYAGADSRLVERRTEHGRRQEDRDILALVGDLERALQAFKSPIIVRKGTPWREAPYAH